MIHTFVEYNSKSVLRGVLYIKFYSCYFFQFFFSFICKFMREFALALAGFGFTSFFLLFSLVIIG